MFLLQPSRRKAGQRAGTKPAGQAAKSMPKRRWTTPKHLPLWTPSKRVQLGGWQVGRQASPAFLQKKGQECRAPD